MLTGPICATLAVISDLDKVTSAKVFHAGTASNAEGQVVSAGGRVLNVTAKGANITEAQCKAYEGVAAISWEDAQFRTDIGWRAVAREAAQ